MGINISRPAGSTTVRISPAPVRIVLFNFANVLPTDGFDPTTRQLVLVEAAAGKFHPLCGRHRQLQTHQFFRFFNSIETGKLEHQPVTVKPPLFNLQRSSSLFGE